MFSIPRCLRTKDPADDSNQHPSQSTNNSFPPSNRCDDGRESLVPSLTPSIDVPILRRATVRTGSPPPLPPRPGPDRIHSVGAQGMEKTPPIGIAASGTMLRAVHAARRFRPF
uniref:Uncharacterized protein n=1 Tax=Corethron hystrix TaxID=216773 RepID=A0A7S1G2L8_9STRA